MFLYTQTAGPGDATQAARRIRHPTKRIINVAVDGNRSKVPTTRQRIQKLFQDRGTILLATEIDRVTKDFEDDQATLQKVLKDLEIGGNVKALTATAINVSLARNLALCNYNEELYRTFLSMGWQIEIVRDKVDNDKLVPKSTVPEKRVFDDHRGALGIVAFYEMHKEPLETKEREETLSEDEMAVVRLYRYISKFTENAQSNHITYQYYKDYCTR